MFARKRNLSGRSRRLLDRRCSILLGGGVLLTEIAGDR
jgi:hypothetical protein